MNSLVLHMCLGRNKRFLEMVLLDFLLEKIRAHEYLFLDIYMYVLFFFIGTFSNWWFW